MLLDEKKYVLIIARGYPSDKYKMNGIFEFDQAKALVEAGIKVIYAAIDIRSIRRIRKFGIENKTIDGVIVYAINIPIGRFPKYIQLKASEIGLNYLYKKISKIHGKPYILHAHFSFQSYIASKLKENINIPLISTEHLSSLMQPKIDKKIFIIAQKAYEKSDSLICVSPALRNVIKEKFNKESIYIPNIVDTKLFDFNDEINDTGTFKFVSTGMLVYRKRFDLLIEAFSCLFKKNKNVSLIIFGEGPMRKSLEIQIEKFNMTDNIKLMGLKSRSYISDELKESNCFVLTSEAETFGVAYIEALASGLPVIGTKCGGPESFINNENGILINVNDKKELINAMEKIIININDFNRKEISKRIREEYSSDAISKKLIELYEKVISEKINSTLN